MENFVGLLLFENEFDIYHYSSLLEVDFGDLIILLDSKNKHIKFGTGYNRKLERALEVIYPELRKLKRRM